MTYPDDLLYKLDLPDSDEYLEDCMLSPVALLVSENRSASALFISPPLSTV